MTQALKIKKICREIILRTDVAAKSVDSGDGELTVAVTVSHTDAVKSKTVNSLNPNQVNPIVFTEIDLKSKSIKSEVIQKWLVGQSQ